MNSLHPRNWHLHVTPQNSKMLSFIIVLLVALFIPLSVTLTQQQQDLRQEAKGKNRNNVSIQSNRGNNRNKKNGKKGKNGKKAKKNGKKDNKKKW